MRQPAISLSLAFALAALLPGGAASAQTADDSLLTASENLEFYRVYTGPDQTSQVEKLTLVGKHYIGSDGQKYEGIVWAEAGATRILIGKMPHATKADYHVALRRTILIPMQGTLVLDTGNGPVYRLKPGAMVLAEDRTGKGHISACDAPTGSKMCLVFQINLPDGESGLQYPAPKRPAPVAAPPPAAPAPASH